MTTGRAERAKVDKRNCPIGSDAHVRRFDVAMKQRRAARAAFVAAAVKLADSGGEVDQRAETPGARTRKTLVAKRLRNPLTGHPHDVEVAFRQIANFIARRRDTTGEHLIDSHQRVAAKSVHPLEHAAKLIQVRWVKTLHALQSDIAAVGGPDGLVHDALGPSTCGVKDIGPEHVSLRIVERTYVMRSHHEPQAKWTERATQSPISGVAR